MLRSLFAVRKFYRKCFVSQRTSRQLFANTRVDLSIFIFKLYLIQYHKWSRKSQCFLLYQYHWSNRPYYRCSCIHSPYRNEWLPLGIAFKSISYFYFEPVSFIYVPKKESLMTQTLLKNSNNAPHNNRTQIGFQNNS